MGAKGFDHKLALFHELQRLIVRGEEDLGDVVVAEPVTVNLSPELFYDLDAR